MIVGAHSEYLPPQTDLPLPEFVRAPAAITEAKGVTPWSAILTSALAPSAPTARPVV